MYSSKVSARGGSLLDRFGTMIYRAWFGCHDRSGVFQRSDLAEGVAASRFQSHRIYLRTIYQEFCNIYRRIALLRTYKLHRCGIPLLTPSERLSHPRHQLHRLRQVRIRNIRTLLTIHPGATLIDLYLLTRPTLVCIIPHGSSGEDCQMGAEILHRDERIDSCKTQMDSGTKNRPSQN